MKKTLLFSAAVVAALSSFAQTDYLNADFYIIGDDVNGNKWALADPSCKFENKGGGIYEWTGEYLQTGFKINDGTWDNVDFNLGNSTQPLVLNEPFPLLKNGNNIKFAEADGVAFSGLNNPKVVLDVTKAAEDEITITVTGEPTGIIAWYFTGSFNEWALDKGNELQNVSGKDYKIENVTITSTEDGGNATFKVSSTGWATQYGSNSEEVFFGAGNYEGTLDIVEGEGGACPFYDEGTYDITVNIETGYIVFSEAGSAVNEINAVNGEAVYYNLQGVRVANPTNGLYIQNVNGKSSKVLVRK